MRILTTLDDTVVAQKQILTELCNPPSDNKFDEDHKEVKEKLGVGAPHNVEQRG